MDLNRRTIDFDQLLEKIDTIRSTKEQYIYHSYLQEYAGKNCELCNLPLNPYGIYLNHNRPICITCFNAYITDKDYLNNLRSFENKISRTNELAAAVSASLKQNRKTMDLELVNLLLKGMSLVETEQMIGFPKRFGSFDYGIESGIWKLGSFEIEIWFKNQTCTEVGTL